MFRPFLAATLLIFLSACADKDKPLTVTLRHGPAIVIDPATVEIRGKRFQLYGVKSLDGSEVDQTQARESLQEALGERKVGCDTWSHAPQAGSRCKFLNEDSQEEVAAISLTLGLATLDRTFEDVWPRVIGEYEILESEARTDCRGLWANFPECR